jgi:GNAT superfamily N-acetyltransferase
MSVAEGIAIGTGAVAAPRPAAAARRLRPRRSGATAPELQRLRTLYGRSATLWAGASGVVVEPARWMALSGARGVNYNVALCHAASGGEAISSSIDEIDSRRMPGLIMVAGDALGEVQHLVTPGWVCVGSVPFMSRRLDGELDVDAEAHRVDAGDMDEVRVLLDAVFGIGPELARVALPDTALTTPGHAVWGLRDAHGELVSCLGAVTVDDAVVVWSMATARTRRREGLGSRLLRGVLAGARAEGVSRTLLQASPGAEAFYRSAGYATLERWQLWSRPRWMLGRA